MKRNLMDIAYCDFSGVLNEYVSYTSWGHSHIHIMQNQNYSVKLEVLSKMQGLNFGLMGYWLRAHSGSRNNC